MTEQPKDFGFGEDETMLRDSAAKFFADNASPDKVHALVAGNPDINRPIECIWEKDLWNQMVELGWPAVCVPEEAGGIGMPLVAAVALAEEAGKSAAPSPLIATFCATAHSKPAGLTTLLRRCLKLQRARPRRSPLPTRKDPGNPATLM